MYRLSYQLLEAATLSALQTSHEQQTAVLHTSRVLM